MSGQSFSIINNLSSLRAQQDLYVTNRNLNTTLARLSSGKRIVSAADDAAGLSIATALNADSTALTQAVRNANDAVAYIQVADGLYDKMTDMITRAVTLAEQAASDTVGSDEKAILDAEYGQIIEELDRMVSVSNFKGERLMSVSSTIQKRIYIGDTHFCSFIHINIGGINGSGTEAMGISCRPGTINITCPHMSAPGYFHQCTLGRSNLLTRDDSLVSLHLLQGALASVSRWRGTLGAQQNRLTNAIGLLQVQNMNLKAAESTISDANMAEEIVNMTKNQILMQSGMSSLAQANSSAQMVLQLLR